MLSLPKTIQSEAQLEELLARPYPETVEFMRRLDGDVMILGAGGKIGPSLARLAAEACRAAGVEKEKRVVAVSRFSDPAAREKLKTAGVETIACDLLDPDAVAKLPSARNIIFMAGRKFGERGSESLTWMHNVVLAENVARVFKGSRIVVFSTGCVYPLVTVDAGGCGETDPPAPVGEYANSCLGRERVFEYHAEHDGTPVLLYRLNYAIDLRYGVLYDIAKAVHDQQPVDLTVGAVNFIWQGDANNRALLCLDRTAVPAVPLNITGPKTHAVRDLARRFAERFGVEAHFINEGKEAPTYLSDASRSVEWFGPPRVSADQLIDWQADWVARGGRSLNKPTHFQVTDGQFLD